MLRRNSYLSVALSWLLILLASATTAHAAVYDWCALGESLKPGQEFIQVRRVRLEVKGAALGDLAASFSEEIIRRRLWPSEAERVHVSPYIEDQCGPSNRNADEVSLSITKTENEELRRELERRGDNKPAPIITTLAGQAEINKVADTKGPPGTSRINWIRIFYATNRKATGQTEAARAFGSEDAEAISWGSVNGKHPANTP